MTVISALAGGLRDVARNKGILIILWGFNLAFAYLAAVPLRSSLGSFLQDNPIAEILRTKPDTLYFQEWLLKGSQTLPIFGALLLLLVLIYWLVSVYTTGGILGAFSDERSGKPLSLRFFAPGATFFGPLFRLGILAAGFYLMLILLFSGFYQKYDGGLSYTSYWIKNSVLAIGTFLAFTVFNAITDYAKIHIVVNQSRRALNAIGAGLRFARRAPLRAAGVYYINLTVLIAATGVYVFLDGLYEADAAFTVFVMFLIQQAYMLIRVLIRMQFLASERTLFLGYQEVPSPGTGLQTGAMDINRTQVV